VDTNGEGPKIPETLVRTMFRYLLRWLSNRGLDLGVIRDSVEGTWIG
jgi:hypothetical protein